MIYQRYEVYDTIAILGIWDHTIGDCRDPYTAFWAVSLGFFFRDEGKNIPGHVGCAKKRDCLFVTTFRLEVASRLLIQRP